MNDPRTIVGEECETDGFGSGVDRTRRWAFGFGFGFGFEPRRRPREAFVGAIVRNDGEDARGVRRGVEDGEDGERARMHELDRDGVVAGRDGGGDEGFAVGAKDAREGGHRASLLAEGATRDARAVGDVPRARDAVVAGADHERASVRGGRGDVFEGVDPAGVAAQERESAPRPGVVARERVASGAPTNDAAVVRARPEPGVVAGVVRRPRERRGDHAVARRRRGPRAGRHDERPHRVPGRSRAVHEVPRFRTNHRGKRRAPRSRLEILQSLDLVRRSATRRRARASSTAR